MSRWWRASLHDDPQISSGLNRPRWERLFLPNLINIDPFLTKLGITSISIMNNASLVCVLHSRSCPCWCVDARVIFYRYCTKPYCSEAATSKMLYRKPWNMNKCIDSIRGYTVDLNYLCIVDGHFEVSYCLSCWGRSFGGQHGFHKRITLSSSISQFHRYMHTIRIIVISQVFCLFLSAPELGVHWLNWMSLPNNLKSSHKAAGGSSVAWSTIIEWINVMFKKTQYTVESWITCPQHTRFFFIYFCL